MKNPLSFLSVYHSARSMVPDFLAPKIKAIAGKLAPAGVKHDVERFWWGTFFQKEGGDFSNDHYGEFMVKMAGQASPDFVAGKIVADFGTQPPFFPLGQRDGEQEHDHEHEIEQEVRARQLPEYGVP